MMLLADLNVNQFYFLTADVDIFQYFAAALVYITP